MELPVAQNIPPRIPTVNYPATNKNFPSLQNDRLLRSARGQEVDKIPV